MELENLQVKISVDSSGVKKGAAETKKEMKRLEEVFDDLQEQIDAAFNSKNYKLYIQLLGQQGQVANLYSKQQDIYLGDITSELKESLSQVSEPFVKVGIQLKELNDQYNEVCEFFEEERAYLNAMVGSVDPEDPDFGKICNEAEETSEVMKILENQIKFLTEIYKALGKEEEINIKSGKQSTSSSVSAGGIAKAIFGIQGIYTVVRKIINENEALTEAIQSIWSTIAGVFEPVFNVIAVLIKTIADWIGKLFGVEVDNEENTEKTANSLASFDTINNIAQQNETESDLSAIDEAIAKLKEAFGADNFNTAMAIISSILQGIEFVVKGIAGLITLIIDGLEAIGSAAAGLLAGAIGVVQSVITSILGIIGGIGKTLSAILQTVFGGIYTLLTEGPKAALGYIKKCWTTVSEFFNYIGNLFKGIYNNALQPAIQLFANAIKGVVNVVVDFLNGIIGIFGGTKISKWSGWTVPKLAAGGLAYGSTLVNVGEYAGAANNPEVIAPLNKLESMLNIDAIAQKMDTLISRVDNLEMNPVITVKDIGKAAMQYNSKQTRIMGGAY